MEISGPSSKQQAKQFNSTSLASYQDKHIKQVKSRQCPESKGHIRFIKGKTHILATNATAAAKSNDGEKEH